MFGYITVCQKELKIKDFDLYRSYYCGLCHALKKQYGRTGQMLLNYDMTFLAILLSALYEPEEETVKARCIPHPVRKHEERFCDVTRYAADMNVFVLAVDRFLIGAGQNHDCIPGICRVHGCLNRIVITFA